MRGCCGVAIKATIKACRSYFPEGRLDNNQLAREIGVWSAQKILDRTGVTVRTVVAPEETASDLGFAAASRLFSDGVCHPSQIDYLLVCTQSPDYFLPSTSCLLQYRLGLPNDCGALDINQGCSGFVYGLSVAKGLIETNAATNVLLVTADTYTKYINTHDRGVRTLFADAGAATLIVATKAEDDCIGPFVFGTDGSGAASLIVPAGAMRCPVSADTARETTDPDGCRRSKQNLYMDGRAVLEFVLREVPVAVNRLISAWGKPMSAIDHFVFHQANKYLLNLLQSKLQIPEHKFWLQMDGGNTVSATIPIALESALARGSIRSGDDVLLAGFGVGLSWATTMIRVA